MRIHIENYATSFGITFHSNGKVYNSEYHSSLDEALEYAYQEIEKEGKADFASIWDANTGELYATCSSDDSDEDSFLDYDEPDPDWGYNEDEGFDPYMGEYTWDC